MESLCVDLNADLGEGGLSDPDLLRLVTSTSVACGVHAGSSATMVSTAAAAARAGVTVGAHPSYDDREGFGRRPLDADPEELVASIVCQIGAMAAAAAAAGTRLEFVKPHGALYNRASADPATAEAVVEGVRLAGRLAANGSLALLCPANSEIARRAAGSGLRAYLEGFADRLYAPDGSLIDRSVAGAVLHDDRQVVSQALDLALRRQVRAYDGSVVELEADSICVHGDTPGALASTLAVRAALERAGVRVSSFLPPDRRADPAARP